MLLSRVLRRWLCAGLAVAWLVAQGASAAYVCPASTRPVGAEAPMTGMPCAQHRERGPVVDLEQAALCHHHCHHGATAPQSTDAPAASFAAVPALVRLFPFAPVLPVEWQAGLPQRQARSLARDPGPPLSVLHCCYRI